MIITYKVLISLKGTTSFSPKKEQHEPYKQPQLWKPQILNEKEKNKYFFPFVETTQL